MNKCKWLFCILAVALLFAGCQNPSSSVTTWTVSFDANEGSGAMSSVSVADGSSYTAPASEFTRTGYGFVDWDTKADGSGSEYHAGDSITVSGDLKLYAIWSQVTYQVSFDANNPNEGDGAMQAVTVGSGDSYEVPACSYTRFPFAFVRWDSRADGTGDSYSPGATISTVTEDLTLHAIWTLRSDCYQFIGFEDGSTLGELARDDGDGLRDPYGMLSIQSDRSEYGSALRQNLEYFSRLDIAIDDTSGYKDMWLMFDIYVESADYFPGGTHKPLIIIYDSSTDATPGLNDLPKMFGVPLFKESIADGDDDYYGFQYVRPISNIYASDGVTDTIFSRMTQAWSYGGMDAWHTIKLHYKGDDATSGVDLYIDNVLIKSTIYAGDTPEDVSIDSLRFWHHGSINNEANEVTSAPDTNIYFDNVGVFSSDPDSFSD